MTYEHTPNIRATNTRRRPESLSKRAWRLAADGAPNGLAVPPAKRFQSEQWRLCRRRLPNQNQGAVNGTLDQMTYKPLHPLRLHSFEGMLRRDWQKFLEERPHFDLLCGPEVSYTDLPDGVESDENKLTGGYQPYPYGRMTARDHMITAEIIQWLGSPIGLNFLAAAFARAGGRLEFPAGKLEPLTK